MNLSLSLKIMSLFYWWYLVAFVLSVLSLLNVHIGYTPDFRGAAYAWDFELFFTAIAVVWAIFLWRSSNNPSENRTFIYFTIWATIAHVIAMLVVGAIRPTDMTHLLLDAGALVIPVLLVMWGCKKELMKSAS